jgi:ankyrin repeat protein
VADKNGLTPLLWAAGIGDPRSVKVLIAAGADLKAADNLTGDTAVMRAARNGKVESLQELIGANADLAATNRQGMTAWLIASANGKVDKLKLLQSAKVDVNARDTRGWNAVDYARNRSDGNRDEVLKYLQDELKLKPAAQQGTP